MPRYRIVHRYSSSDFGPFDKGTEIELTPEEAAWLEHDSPGVLEEIDPDKAREEKKAANAERAKAYDSKTEAEQAKTSTTRRGRPPGSGRAKSGGS